MTNGEKLKKTIGLEDFHTVWITRLLLPTSLPIYYIIYDSKRKNLPLPKQIFRSKPFVSMTYHGSDLQKNRFKKPTWTPLMNILDWGGTISSSFFTMVDVSCAKYLDKRNFSRLPESTQSTLTKANISIYIGKNILKELTIADLKDSDNVSLLTQRTTSERQSTTGGANINTKLLDTDINTNDGSVTFKFLTESTKDIYPADYDYQEVNPNNSQLMKNESKTYELWLKILNVFGKDSWLSTYEDKDNITLNDIKEILKVSDIQLWSNDPSWTYQGFQYWNDQIDTSIFPQNIKPKKWDKFHGDGQSFLTKHFNQLFKQIAFFSNQMASSLNKKLKDRGFI